MKDLITLQEAAFFLNITIENIEFLIETKHLKLSEKESLISGKSIRNYDRQETHRQETELIKLVRMSEELKLY